MVNNKDALRKFEYDISGCNSEVHNYHKPGERKEIKVKYENI